MSSRFVDSPEQAELARGARAFVERRIPVAALRGVRARPADDRIDRALWRECAQLGWAGILVGEGDGGAGLGMIEAGLVAEQLGRTLAPTPFLSTAIIGGTLVPSPALAGGDQLVALALDETPFFDARASCETIIRDRGVIGAKRNVLDGPAADRVIVRTQDALAIVDARGPGVTITALDRVDSRSVADLRFDRAPVIDTLSLDHLDRAITRATAALAAEMLGGADAVFATTLAYLKERRQFGVPIGSFQALKHRAAQIFCELELTRSIVRAALAALDANAPDAEPLVSAAKARASDTYLLATAEAIQMHGGIGVTDELDIGLYYKRAMAASMLFGDAAYHRDRFARLAGY